MRLKSMNNIREVCVKSSSVSVFFVHINGSKVSNVSANDIQSAFLQSQNKNQLKTILFSLNIRFGVFVVFFCPFLCVFRPNTSCGID